MNRMHVWARIRTGEGGGRLGDDWEWLGEHRGETTDDAIEAAARWLGWNTAAELVAATGARLRATTNHRPPARRRARP